MRICQHGSLRDVTGAALVLTVFMGCSGASNSDGAGVGGAMIGGGPASGGSTSGPMASGTTTTGGIVSTGSNLTQGGFQAAGGINASGGNNPGGSMSSGGVVAAGGSYPSGGSIAGGGKASGGATSSTGGKASGGASAVGGTRAAGGKSAGGAPSGGSASGGKSSGGGTSTCPTSVLKSGDSTKTITVGGLSREYILHVPSAYTGSAAVPLVLDFHPIGGSATTWRGSSPYPAVIDKEGVISAFPNGKTGPRGNAWNVGGCCVSKVNGDDVDDVAFAKAIVQDIQKVACVDAKRVYAVGFSMGGGMSNYLACHAADVFAAVGPAAFDLTQQNEPGCTPARPISVIEWRGKNDNIVPYAGGHSALVTGMEIDFLGAVGTFQKWASKDGCTGSAGAADSNNCQTYAQCSAGVQVTLCTANSGGHEAANASVVWPMLKKHTLP